jgi:hypothetical protein
MWRAASQRSALGACARWRAWLLTQGIDLQSEAPAARITPARIQAYVAFLQEERSSVTSTTEQNYITANSSAALDPHHDLIASMRTKPNRRHLGRRHRP